MKNLSIIAQTVFFTLLFLNVKAQYAPENVQQEIRANVDWIFGLDDNPSPQKAFTPVILATPYGTTNSVRGLTGGKSCGSIAVLYTLVGYRQAALSWLNAAQSHNPGVMALFNAYPDYTLDYAASQYKNQAYQYGVGGPYGALIVALFNQLNR